MFIVKKRSELIRFGLFLLLAGLMAYFVAGRFASFQAARADRSVQPVAPGPVVAGPQSDDLLTRATEAGSGVDFFAETRMERERNRGSLKSTLKAVMDDPDADAQVRSRAAEQYINLGTIASLEEKAEEMVKAKGFTDVLVYLTEDSAQVVIKGPSTSQQQFMQVVDMVSKVTGVKPASVVVIPRER